MVRMALSILLSYSLGDAIDWKLHSVPKDRAYEVGALLLARGCDRLETIRGASGKHGDKGSPTR